MQKHMNTVIWQPLKGLKTCVPFTRNSLNLMTLRHKPTLSLSLVFLIAFVLFPVYQLFPTHLFSSIPYLFIKNTFRAWRHYKKEWGRTIERSAASKEKNYKAFCEAISKSWLSVMLAIMAGRWFHATLVLPRTKESVHNFVRQDGRATL